MRVPITPVTTLQRELRAQVRQHYPAGRVIVAVDGFRAAQTAAFADSWAAIFAEDGSAVFRATTDDFLRPRHLRSSDEDDVYDVATFRRVLIDPFREGLQTSATTGFQLTAWDARRDAPAESRWMTAPDDAVLVVDGAFLHGAHLRGLWNWSVWLEVSPEVLAERPGRTSAAPYTESEFRYQHDARPAAAAGAIIDNTDPQLPVQVFRDSC